MNTFKTVSAMAALTVAAAANAIPMSRGSWIWTSGPANPRNLHAYFRKSVSLTGAPAEAVVRVTADNRYELWINGRRVSRGPARSHTRWLAYDTVDIAPYLHSGSNVIAVLVQHYGEWTFRSQVGRAGLLLEADIKDGGNTISVQTDATWKCLSSAAWDRSVEKMGMQLAYPDIYDARKEPAGWTAPGFDDSKWSQPVVIGPAGTAPWTDLTASPLPRQVETPVRPAAVAETLCVKPLAVASHIDLLPLMDRKGWGVAYVTTCLFAPAACDVTLQMGCDDAGKAWLDGAPVLEQREAAQASPARVSASVHLKPGWHRVMVKVVQLQGPWRLYFGVAGAGAKGLALSSEKVKSAPGTWRLSPVFEYDGSKGFQAGYNTAYAPETGGAGADWRLVKAPLEPIRQPATAIRSEGHLEAADTCVSGAGTLTTPAPAAVFTSGPGADGAVLLDMGREVMGYPHITIKGAKGGEIVDMGYGEALVGPDGAYVSPTAHTKGRLNPEYRDVAYADRFICRPGDNTFEPMDKRAFRYWQIDVRTSGHPVTMSEAYVALATYPVAYRGAFECSDPLLNRIWEVGRWTLQLNMDDAYTDCPWRERAQWWGDARIESLANYYAFGDSALIRRALIQAAESQDDEGLVHGVFPTDWDGARLPSFALMWVQSLWEYYLYTGDASLLKDLMPRIDRLMGFFQARMSDEGGLLKDVPYWVFIDWAPGMEVQRFGVSGPLNCLYYQALTAMANISQAAGDPDKSARYAEKAVTVKGIINRMLWSSKDRVYIGAVEKGVLTGPPSQQMSSLVVAFGIAPADRWRDTMEAADRDPSAVKIGSPYFSSFYLDALFRMGQHDKALAYLRTNWGAMLDWGATTFWEKWEPVDSLCHAWSSCPTRDLPAQYLGVRPTAPGWREWKMAPALCDLAWAKGTVPTPLGDIKAAWKRDGQSLSVSLGVPKGSTARFLLPVKGWESVSWKVNGRSPAASGASLEKADGQWIISLSQSGDYDITAVGTPS